MEYEIREVYDRFYDNQFLQKNASLLGKFQVIEQIAENDWDELFVGRNIDTGEVCLINGSEVCGFGSGTRYTIYPLKHLCVKE